LLSPIKIFLFIFVLLSVDSFAEQKDSKEKHESLKESSQEDLSKTVAYSLEAAGGGLPKVKFNSFFGSQILDKIGFGIGAKLGLSISKKKRWYLGPDLHFSTFSPGYFLNLGLGIWYEIPVFGVPRLYAVTGLTSGVGLSSQLAGVSSTVPAVFLTLALAQRVDDLVDIWGEIKPGWFGSGFTFLLDLNVSFRFGS